MSLFNRDKTISYATEGLNTLRQLEKDRHEGTGDIIKPGGFITTGITPGSITTSIKANDYLTDSNSWYISTSDGVEKMTK